VSLRCYAPDGIDAARTVEEMRAQARLAVEHGFDGVMTSEHHAGFPGYVPNPLQVAGFLLDAMPTGWAAPCPVLLPLRPTALVAEEIAWLAARHPGRVGIGVAAGALERDFDVMDASMDGLTARFATALDRLAGYLRGDAGVLAGDRAIERCAVHPIPMVSAAASATAARRAARAGVGLLFDSLVTPQRARELVDVHRAEGGTGPCVLVRRAWIGAPPRRRVDEQVDVYREYAPSSAPAHWGNDELISGEAPDDVAGHLVARARAAGADALNLRVHAPGIGIDAVREQIERLGEVLPRVRAALTTG
jgi:alkanesulfonate monooxygenase SsuD/methylene tetrahydromethanopterin reductase-like flavin-dependent oxidoreductase (luciferase family)